MARHCTHDRILISALVCVAIHSLACSQVDYLMNNAQLTEAGKKSILAAIDRFNAPDPFSIKAAIGGEHQWAAVWLRGQLAQPGGMEIITSQIMPMAGQDNTADVTAIRAMDAAGALADLDKADAFYAAARDAFDQPDAAERFAALEQRAHKDEFGIIAKQIVPAMTKCNQSNAKGLARQSDTRARLANFIARPN